MENIQLLIIPFFACLLIAAIHCYMGMHIVRRGVIFVDIALAQCAALGASIGLLKGYDEESLSAYALSLAFTFFGAALFAIGRFKDEAVPHEAIIGIVYVVSTALTVLVLDKSPHGLDEMKTMLVGNILFVNWQDVFELLALYVVLGVFCLIFHKKFWDISTLSGKIVKTDKGRRLWDFIFYCIFGVMVTRSVRVAGVLLVFSFLVIPAVCSLFFVNKFVKGMIIAWGIAIVASAIGLGLSGKYDFPTGAALVSAFGITLLLSAVARFFIKKN
ncbi:MAG: metal ABC transporter permease [Candidatus Schekmanbacteria bacterium]|nr:metal ABC transporter permease [Candidatus Schekmanbacteria bacterium]